MPERHIVTIDGNEAAAYVAHKTNEVIAIYPITPVQPDGRMGGLVERPGKGQHLGHDTVGCRDASRRWCSRSCPWRPPDWLAHHNLHGIPRPAPDDPQHVQNRRGTDIHSLSHCRPDSRHARVVNLW